MSLKRKLKYIFFVCVIFWVLIGTYVFYKYLISNPQNLIAKGGTFVEGIFDDISFLPYLNNNQQSKFYQGLLYKSCLSHYKTGINIEFRNELCNITTTDYKIYYISLITGHIRSNGVPVGIEDVFFTYNDIIRHNVWSIPHLGRYSDILIEMNNDGRIKLTFPDVSIDNTLFFLNYILPSHALNKTGADILYYQKDFATEPIYTKCSRIVPQTIDPNSLIFNLSNCSDTYLGFYQIKKISSFEEFKSNIINGDSIIDLYQYNENLTGYISNGLITNKSIFVFFNTESNKTRVRTRRALGGLISYNFNKIDHQLLKENDDRLFSTFESTGQNIENFLGGNSDEFLSKRDLIDGGVKNLPVLINLSGSNNRLTYFVENINNLFTVTFNLDVEYDKIGIQHEEGNIHSPKTYIKSKKTFKYNISPKLENLKPGPNKYYIYGFVKDDKKTIASIDVYNLKGDIPKDVLGTNTGELNKINIIYVRNKIFTYVVEQLQKIFLEKNILNYFNFQGVDDIFELEGKLIMGDYDIVIGSIDMGLNKDISKLFAIQDVKKNPSKYTNQKMVQLIQQYLTSNINNNKLLDDINITYQRDMPFIILGKEILELNIKESLYKKLSGDIEFSEYFWRNELYNNLRIVENVNVDIKNTGGIKDFLNFIRNSIKGI